MLVESQGGVGVKAEWQVARRIVGTNRESLVTNPESLFCIVSADAAQRFRLYAQVRSDVFEWYKLKEMRAAL